MDRRELMFDIMSPPPRVSIGGLARIGRPISNHREPGDLGKSCRLLHMA